LSIRTCTNFLIVKSRDAPDSVFAGYPASRISGQPDIRLIQKPDTPDIRPDTWLNNYTFGKISNKFIKTALTILDLCKHAKKHDLVTKLILVSCV
jgi:hypothetical protein